MRGILALMVAMTALASAANASPLAATTVAGAADSNPVIIAIGTVSDNNNKVTKTVVAKTSPSLNSHENGTGPPLTILNIFGGAVGPNNTIYIVGARPSETENVQYTFLSYNVQADKWTELPPFTYQANPTAVVVVGTQLLSIGVVGFRLSASVHDDDEPSVYAFDLSDRSNQTWVEVSTPLPLSDSLANCAVVTNNTVYYLLQSGELFGSSDAAQSWKQLASMPVPRAFVGCAAMDDHIVVAGGVGSDIDGPFTASVYEVTENQWRETKPMSKLRLNPGVVALPLTGGNSHVVVCGGQGEDPEELSYVDCETLWYNRNEWSPAGFELGAQFPHSLYGLFASQD